MVIKVRFLMFYGIVFLAVIGCKNQKSIPKSESKADLFQSILDSVYNANKGCVGLMAHIEAPGKNISWSGAVGVADSVTKVVLQRDQPVLIASNTKTYVAVAILRLAEQGKVELDSKIEHYISKKSKQLLEADGYRPNDISLKHLLTHTGGLFDYAGSEKFFEFIATQPNYRWTRDEQIELAISEGEPLGKPGEVFSYSDTNYLLASEIIETLTGQEFYVAMRELLKFDQLHLDATWFSSLEQYPENVLPLAYQYSSEEGVNSYSLDHSFDLYGGGGLASTTKDLAVFLHGVFNHKVFDDPETVQLLFTEVETKQPKEWDYFFGISPYDFNGLKGYGHNGYWGTIVNHFPELNTTISVFVLERDKRYLRVDLTASYLKVLKDLE
ncbi:beta-lactamase family protein [Hyunsoonleella sp. SJ7]|uniref:Beta-lactamase family protein n=1 Tax=Hyunsoonleella aquatilis TaxID=2762758 RepID=A0A923H9M3_9FLAO|nr:serine hydrolase domain-containing protein [Hyunsoonleella aquatilis]MBC3758179.1 beta-lactamase family protein [Hyunsoonleella aquatilis]